MRTDRLETFADGVLAIAATLLILNVDTQIGERATWRTSCSRSGRRTRGTP
jgi:uncharacterized membrane protein